MDATLLARIQFAVTIIYHFLFVPLSIGIGAILVLAERRYCKTNDPDDKAASDFWIKIFTATFAVGVATGITMEFAFGTNWASFSRFVGDIFGAPLAAEALFSFFLESSFLAVLLFGRSRVSKRFFYVSTWLVWLGSLLSAFWIIIADSWMQSPAGYKIVKTAAGSKAVLTDFFAAAFNPTTIPRYLHTIDAILIMGGFMAIGIAAYYLYKGRNLKFAKRTMAVGAGLALIASVAMGPLGHLQAVSTLRTQPEKIAALEGQWESGPIDLGIVGWIDTKNEKSYVLAIPNGISYLADFNTKTVYPSIKEIRAKAEAKGIPDGGLPPLQLTFQIYRGMILLFPVMLIAAFLAWYWNRKDDLEKRKKFLKFLIWAPLAPMLAIQFGWAAAEIGRQPWTVYNLLLTRDAVSATVPAAQILVTLIGFTALYTLIYVAWARVVCKMIKKGPQTEDSNPHDASSQAQSEVA